LSGWVFEIATGEVHVFDPDEMEFVPVEAGASAPHGTAPTIGGILEE
jgi:hypothetical protein